MKRILLLILVTGILLLVACGGNGITHYVNEEFGYSIDYPEGWVMEELSENEIGIKPADSQYNQIQINSYVGEPTIDKSTPEMVAAVYQANLELFAQTLGGINLFIEVNEPAEEKWDWVVEFTLSHNEIPLQGGIFVMETETITYTIFFVQSTDWSEGQEVIDSFSPTE